mgnify:CR=1 FL=1
MNFIDQQQKNFWKMEKMERSYLYQCGTRLLLSLYLMPLSLFSRSSNQILAWSCRLTRSAQGNAFLVRWSRKAKVHWWVMVGCFVLVVVAFFVWCGTVVGDQSLFGGTFRIPTKAELEIFPPIDYSVQVKNKTKSLWNIPCHVSPAKNDNDGPTNSPIPKWV